MTDSNFNYMKEAIATDLAELLAKDFGMDIAESLDTLYNSETYAKLSDPNTGLWWLLSFPCNPFGRWVLAGTFTTLEASTESLWRVGEPA